MQIFLENEGKTVKATIDGKDYSYRAGALTHFGSGQVIENLIDNARAYLADLAQESRAAGKNETLTRREVEVHIWAITNRAAPVLAADIDGVFSDYDSVINLMDNQDGDRFTDLCAEAALLLNPQLNPARADFYQQRRDQEAKRQADFLESSQSGNSPDAPKNAA